MTTKEINLHAAYLYKYCVEHKDCLTCQIPKNHYETCIWLSGWSMESITDFENIEFKVSPEQARPI